MARRSLAELDALALTAGIWFVAKFLRYAFPPLFPTFRDLYGVSGADLGLAFTGLMVVYALAQFPSGALADRFGSARIVTAGALLAALAAFAISTGVPYPVLVACMLVVGLGTGVHKTVAVGLLSRVYPATTGRVLGVLDTFGAFGGIVAPALVVAVVGGPGWGVVFLAASAAGVVLAATFALRVPRHDAAGRPPGDGDRTPFRAYGGLFADRRFVAFVLVTIGFSFAYNGVVAFLPLYLTDAAGLAPALAGLLYSVLFVVSVVQVATGELGDRLGRLTVSVATVSLAAAGLAGVLVADTPLGLGVAVVAFGLGSHGFRPVRGAHLVALIPDSLAGGGLGVVRTLLMGAGALAPAVVGLVAETASYRVAFGLLFAALAAAAAGAAGLRATA